MVEDPHLADVSRRDNDNQALAVDPAQAYTVAVGDDSDASTFLAAMAEATGGKSVTDPDTATFVATLKSVIVQVGSTPLVTLSPDTYHGLTGEPVTLSAAGTRTGGETVTGYDWDFDGNGTYDATTTTPTTTHTYVSAGTKQIVVRAHTAAGLTGSATGSVVVTNPVTSAPHAPTSLHATGSDGAVTLSWHAGDGPAPTYYTVTDGAGTVLDRFFAPDGGGTVEWTDPRLTNGTTYTYKVSGGNEHGDGPAAGPVEAIAGGGATSSPSPTASAAPTEASPTDIPTTPVLAPPIGRGHLPVTGDDIKMIAVIGLALLVAGGVLAAITIKRRRKFVA